MKTLNWLNRPYPFIEELKIKILVSFSFGLFIYLFLVVFLPFGLDDIIASKSIYLMGFGWITALVLLFNYTISPLLFPKLFDPDRWKIKKEISFIIVSIMIIAFINYKYNSIVGYQFAEQHGLGYFIPVTVVVGIFPVTLVVFVTELFLSKKHQKTASDISLKIRMERESTEPVTDRIIEIISDTKKDNFEINESDLIFVKSEDNYCKVFYQENEEIKTQLLRITLKAVEKQLGHFTDIIRCHRSYIVNKKHISRISGNARAYNVHFDKCIETITVSRSFPKEQLLA